MSKESVWAALSVGLLPLVVALLWRPELWLGAVLTSIGIAAIALGVLWAIHTSKALAEIRDEVRKLVASTDDREST
jgi:hypothetical protein